MPNRTAPTRTRAIQSSTSRSRPSRPSVSMALLDSRQRPLRLLAQQRVVTVGVRCGELGIVGAPDIAERHERVPPQVARVVARDVQALVAAAQLVPVDS